MVIRKKKAARIGNQTPTQSVFLPYDKSLYRQLIKTYDNEKYSNGK